MEIDGSKYSIIRTHYGEIEHYQPRILRAKSVCTLIGVSRSTIYNWINCRSPWYVPNFPKPVKIGNAAIGWLEEELVEYLRAASRSGRKS